MYTVINAECIANANPLDFRLPDFESRENLEEGSLVKLEIQHHPTGVSEITWVIARRWSETTYKGTLLDDGKMIKLKSKETVMFQPKHIQDIVEIRYFPPEERHLNDYR